LKIYSKDQERIKMSEKISNINERALALSYFEKYWKTLNINEKHWPNWYKFAKKVFTAGFKLGFDIGKDID